MAERAALLSHHPSHARRFQLLKVRKLEAAARQDPRDALVRTRLGDLFAELGDCESALACFVRVIELGAQSAFIYWRMGRVLYEMESFAEAALALDNAAPRDAVLGRPFKADAAANAAAYLARALVRSGEPARAAEACAVLLAVAPLVEPDARPAPRFGGLGCAHVFAASVALQSRDVESALAHYMSACIVHSLSLRPYSRVDVWLLVSRAYEAWGRPRLAMAAAAVASSGFRAKKGARKPKATTVASLVAHKEKKQKRKKIKKNKKNKRIEKKGGSWPTRSSSESGSESESEPVCVGAWLRLARIHEGQDDFAGALDALEVAAARAPWNKDVVSAYVRCLERVRPDDRELARLRRLQSGPHLEASRLAEVAVSTKDAPPRFVRGTFEARQRDAWGGEEKAEEEEEEEEEEEANIEDDDFGDEYGDEAFCESGDDGEPEGDAAEFEDVAVLETEASAVEKRRRRRQQRGSVARLHGTAALRKAAAAAAEAAAIERNLNASVALPAENRAEAKRRQRASVGRLTYVPPQEKKQQSNLFATRLRPSSAGVVRRRRRPTSASATALTASSPTSGLSSKRQVQRSRPQSAVPRPSELQEAKTWEPLPAEEEEEEEEALVLRDEDDDSEKEEEVEVAEPEATLEESESKVTTAKEESKSDDVGEEVVDKSSETSSKTETKEADPFESARKLLSDIQQEDTQRRSTRRWTATPSQSRAKLQAKSTKTVLTDVIDETEPTEDVDDPELIALLPGSSLHGSSENTDEGGEIHGDDSDEAHNKGGESKRGGDGKGADKEDTFKRQVSNFSSRLSPLESAQALLDLLEEDDVVPKPGDADSEPDDDDDDLDLDISLDDF